jgi:hypothetical protein
MRGQRIPFFRERRKMECVCNVVPGTGTRSDNGEPVEAVRHRSRNCAQDVDRDSANWNPTLWNSVRRNVSQVKSSYWS